MSKNKNTYEFLDGDIVGNTPTKNTSWQTVYNPQTGEQQLYEPKIEKAFAAGIPSTIAAGLTANYADELAGIISPRLREGMRASEQQFREVAPTPYYTTLIGSGLIGASKFNKATGLNNLLSTGSGASKIGKLLGASAVAGGVSGFGAAEGGFAPRATGALTGGAGGIATGLIGAGAASAFPLVSRIGAVTSDKTLGTDFASNLKSKPLQGIPSENLAEQEFTENAYYNLTNEQLKNAKKQIEFARKKGINLTLAEALGGKAERDFASQMMSYSGNKTDLEEFIKTREDDAQKLLINTIKDKIPATKNKPIGEFDSISESYANLAKEAKDFNSAARIERELRFEPKYNQVWKNKLDVDGVEKLQPRFGMGQDKLTGAPVKQTPTNDLEITKRSLIGKNLFDAKELQRLDDEFRSAMPKYSTLPEDSVKYVHGLKSYINNTYPNEPKFKIFASELNNVVKSNLPPKKLELLQKTDAKFGELKESQLYYSKGLINKMSKKNPSQSITSQVDQFFNEYPQEAEKLLKNMDTAQRRQLLANYLDIKTQKVPNDKIATFDDIFNTPGKKQLYNTMLEGKDGLKKSLEDINNLLKTINEGNESLRAAIKNQSPALFSQDEKTGKYTEALVSAVAARNIMAPAPAGRLFTGLLQLPAEQKALIQQKYGKDMYEILMTGKGATLLDKIIREQPNVQALGKFIRELKTTGAIGGATIGGKILTEGVVNQKDKNTEEYNYDFLENDAISK